jgi:exopolysaccharide biosynthesis polyprenyl glycosylphosphotransferase
LVRIGIVAVLSLFVTHVAVYLFDVSLAPTIPVASVAGGAALVAMWRLVYMAWAKSAAFQVRTLILGTGPKAQLVANLLRQEQGLRYALLGQVTQQPMIEYETPDGLPILPVSTSIFDLARDLQADKIVVALDGELSPMSIGDLIACQTYGIRVCSVSDLYDQLYTKIPVENVDAGWLLEALLSSSQSYRQLVKRGLDLSLSLLALPWFMLVFPLLALAIKLDSPGPVFYRQVRTGLGGKPFEILKFRTMYTNAEQDGRARWAQKDDPRITRLGKFLRKSRLDEIPQFINILRGDMSLIGPRPERPEFIEQLEKEIPNYSFRLLVPPGLTGWAQIKYTYGNTIDDARIKLEYDTYYVRHWSLWMDIYILFQTVSVVLRAKGT